MDQDEMQYLEDDTSSSIVVISRTSGEEENGDWFAVNPHWQAAPHDQSSGLPPEHSHTERSAAEEFPGEDQTPRKLPSRPASLGMSEAKEEPHQCRDHGDSNSQVLDTSPWPLDRTEPAQEEQPLDQGVGHRLPEPSSDKEEGGDGMPDIELPQYPALETQPRHQPPAQDPSQALSDDGNTHGHHSEIADPGPDRQLTESAHSPQREDNPRMQSMEAPPQVSTPSHVRPHQVASYGNTSRYGSPGHQPSGAMPPTQQRSPYGNGDETSPRGRTPTQGQPGASPDPRYRCTPPPGYQGPSPQLAGAGPLPMKHGFLPGSENQPHPGGPTPTLPQPYVDPCYFQGFHPGYQGPPGQSPVQGQLMGEQHPRWNLQQMPGYSYPFPPAHGHPGPWPGLPPQYAPATQPWSPVQRPYPVKASPTGKPGGPNRGLGNQETSARAKETATTKKEARGGQMDVEVDDIRPEDSISCVGVPKVQMSVAEKLWTWKQDQPDPLPDPGCNILQVKRVPQSANEGDVADFFEHKKRGGFQVDKVEIDVRTRIALVYFQDPSGVQEVLRTGPHRMEKMLLELAAYSPVTEEDDTNAEYRRILHVTGLRAGTDEDEVADYFEHRKRGGFAVEKVELLSQASSALVYFESAAAVEAVLQTGPFEIKKKGVEVRPYSPPALADPAQAANSGCILEVSGIPEDTDKDDVADFFENKKRGGFDVNRVEIDEETQTALVYFDDPTALQVILEKAPFTMHKASISVKPHVPEEEIDPRSVLHVLGLPEDVDEDDVADYFESKKRGGFPVSRVDLDEKTRSAKVHFKDVSAVQTVLQKAPLKMEKKQIEVKQYVPPKKKDYSRMLLVRDLPGTADDEDVADFFESKKRGGYTVEQVDLFPKQRTAVVYFEDPQAVSVILAKVPLKIGSKKLDVSKCTAGALKRVVEMEECAREEEHKEEPQQEDSSVVLQVADLPDSVNEETLTNFFENRRVSGGCPVGKVELDRVSKRALVYFGDPTAVETVLQRAPFLINKKKVSVSAYVPAPAKAAHGKAPGQGSPEGEESCVVAVRGYGTMSEETLEMYFENSKKSEGQDVQSCTVDEKKEVVYVTFKSPEVAKRVSEKTDHILGGRTLTVSLHRARPTCPDRVLLTGLPLQVSRENLVNFLEARVKLTPKDILFGEEEGTALVIFDEAYDLESLEKALKQRKLEGSEVKARPVAVSDAVLVRGVSPAITKDALELYFDNTRKSGGEDVQGVEKLGEGTWLVSFAQHQVATRVGNRAHCLGSVNLQVSLYVDCLGAGGGDRDPCSFPIPHPLSIPGPHPYLVRFLRESPSQGQALKETLTQRHAQAKLDDVTGLTVTCTLTRETPQVKRLAKTWTEDVQIAVGDFLGKFLISKITMTATVYAEVEKERKKFQSPAEKAMVYSEPASFTFVVIGEPKFVDETAKTISDLKKHQEAELERKKQTVTETITTLKNHQLKFLVATNLLGDMMKKQKGLKVEVNVHANKIVFTGLFNHVKDAQIKMFEFVQKLSSDKSKISKTLEAFLLKKSVESYVVGRLREKGLVAVWELTDRELRMWAATDQDVVQAAHVIKAAVQERTLNLDLESVALLGSKEWSDLVKRTEDRDGRVVITTDNARAEVIMTGVDDRLTAALEDVRNFFTENAVYKQRLRFPPGRQRFLTEHLSSDIHQLETNNRAYRVSITFSKRSPEFKLEGTKTGLARVVDGLAALGASISSEKHTLNDKGLAEFLNSGRWEEVLTLVQSTGRCIIQRKDDSTDQPTLTGAGVQMGTSQSGIYQLGNSVILRVTQGDLTGLKVDAVVNAANDRLKHMGGLARAISDRAGPSLQKECDAYVRQHGPLREGDVMVTGAGKLICKKVIHAVGPRYQGGQSGEEDRLTATITGSLREAQALSLTSIAMPAISCGVFGYPVKEATQVIVEAVVEFVRANVSNSLREIVLCDNSTDTLTHFHQAAARLLKPLDPDDLEEKGSARGISTETGGARPRGSLDTPRTPRTSGDAGRVRAVLGEMALQMVDVMVNTTASSLNLTHGTVSSSLLKAAGKELQEEVNARYPSGLLPGEHFAVTNAHRLQAKRVYHTSLPDWKAGGEKFLRELLEKSVRAADSQGFSSIAFPALGTGVLNYPRDVVARCFQDVASSLLPACRSLKEIRIVIFPSDQASVKAFRGMMDGGNTGAPVHTPAWSQQSEPGPASVQYKPSRVNRSFWSKNTPRTAKVPPPPRMADDRVHAFHINDVVLVVKMGNLLEEDVHAIVNSTDSKIDLKRGAVAQAILAKCGNKLEDECNSSKTQSKMKSQGVAVTSSPGLQSQKIIHVDGDHFGNKWTDGIKACLEKAVKHKLATVAFPALGTGKKSLKPADSAMAFIEAIKDMHKSQVKTIREIRVVIYQPEMFTAFAETIQKVMATPEAKSKGWFTKMLEFFTGEMSPDGAMTTQQERRAASVTSVTLYLFSDRPVEIQQALERIKKMYDRNLTKQEIENGMIKKFGEDEQNMIKNLEEAFKVQASVDKNRGVVAVKGLSQDVIQAVTEVHTILRDMEQERHMEEGAEVVSNYVQWCFLDDSDPSSMRKEYDKKTNAILEREYKKQIPFTKITDSDGFTYVFNFNDMEEYPEHYPEDKVKLLRRDLLQKGYHQALPDNWAPMKDDEELKVVQLKTQDTEYAEVETELRRTLGSRKISVTKIDRIQNRTLHDQYMAKKQAMEKQNPGVQNEKKLWHGTAANAVVSINHYGFNRSYCGKNAVAYGNGVYFAVNSEYSTHLTYSPPDSNGDRLVYSVRVLTGEFTAGKGGMRVPPTKSGHVLYDSVVDNMTNPDMHVVFNDTQAYPDYLITFR